MLFATQRITKRSPVCSIIAIDPSRIQNPNVQLPIVNCHGMCVVWKFSAHPPRFAAGIDVAFVIIPDHIDATPECGYAEQTPTLTRLPMVLPFLAALVLVDATII
jgi:hypothetical protein